MNESFYKKALITILANHGNPDTVKVLASFALSYADDCVIRILNVNGCRVEAIRATMRHTKFDTQEAKDIVDKKMPIKLPPLSLALLCTELDECNITYELINSKKDTL